MGDISLLDYEVESLEPWKQALEGQDSRETLPSLRRVERRSPVSASFPMAAGKARRHTGLIQHHMTLNAVGRPGRGSYNHIMQDWDQKDDNVEAQQEFEDLNEQIFMFPASYLIPETLVYFIHNNKIIFLKIFLRYI